METFRAEKTLYVSDLDGTLLNSDSRVSGYTARVVEMLVAQGGHFTYATARSLSSALVVTQGLAANLPVIVYNGAFIRNARTGETLLSLFFSDDQARSIRRVLEEYGLHPLVYALRDGAERVSWTPAFENEGMRHYISARKGDRRLFPTGDVYQGNMFYFTCIGEKAEMEPAYERLRKLAGVRCLLQRELGRTEYWMEAMPADASKRNAATRLKETLGCDRIVAFGDALNDKDLFQAADACYAVKNAVPELKRIATGVIGGNDEDGVAAWLWQNALKREETAI